MKSKQYRNTAFLIELLVNVFVLCISCAILIGVFVSASLTVRSTNRANAATNEVNAVLQTAKLRGWDGLNAEAQPDGSLLLGYDEDWQPTAAVNAAYLLTLWLEEEPYDYGTLERVQVLAAATDGNEICSYTTAFYRPQGGAA